VYVKVEAVKEESAKMSDSEDEKAKDRANPFVEEKFERIFRVNREMRDEILVYDPFLTKI
jgi:hypothetical protein